MTEGQLRSISLSRNPFRLVVCLAFLLLLTPVAEQAHADHCDVHACAVCAAPAGNALPTGTDCTPLTFRPVRAASLLQPDAPKAAAVSDIRPRGPPLS